MVNEQSLGMEVIAWIAWGTGIIGVGVLAWGVLVGVVELIKLELHRIRGRDIAHERAVVRQDLGYYILLSLEFLIAADIMHTIRHPTLQDLAVLGTIVVIRTVISYYLTHEMQDSGRLDGWSRGRQEAGPGSAKATD